MGKILFPLILVVAFLQYTHCKEKTDKTDSILDKDGLILLDSRVFPDSNIEVGENVNLEIMMDPEANFGEDTHKQL